MNWNIIENNWKQFKGKTHEVSSKEECMMEEEILPRRIVLRGALAVGCGLLLPTIFAGCDSNKGANSSSSAPTDSATASTSSAAPVPTSKASQASVQYQTQPKGGQKCSECMHFIADSNTCKLVDGQISPDGWCILWVKKA
ncbi:MAG: high-potential iron-sulfur protein [Methylotenera sp.]|nr:high-potential iron-sulfur protein [Methylotenera sp.]MDP1721393.1 high-potential iron-sulfur protein [Candidatus Nanopelagicaceae bacterium]